MFIGSELRAKRTMAGIAGSVICVKTAITRSRLSDIERGYVTPRAEEFARINAALDELIVTKQTMNVVGVADGWPVPM